MEKSSRSWVSTIQQNARSFAGATTLLLYIELWQGLQSFSTRTGSTDAGNERIWDRCS